MNRLRLNDGTEIQVSHCSEGGGVLRIHLTTEADIVETAALFSDASKTVRMEFTYDGGMERVYERYTRLTRVGFDEYERVTEIMLRRPLAGE